jgi:hypothetical protein
MQSISPLGVMPAKVSETRIAAGSLSSAQDRHDHGRPGLPRRGEMVDQKFEI